MNDKRWPTDGTCIECGAVPRDPTTGLCATCSDEPIPAPILPRPSRDCTREELLAGARVAESQGRRALAAELREQAAERPVSVPVPLSAFDAGWYEGWEPAPDPTGSRTPRDD